MIVFLVSNTALFSVPLAVSSTSSLVLPSKTVSSVNAISSSAAGPAGKQRMQHHCIFDVVLVIPLLTLYILLFYLQLHNQRPPYWAQQVYLNPQIHRQEQALAVFPVSSFFAFLTVWATESRLARRRATGGKRFSCTFVSDNVRKWGNFYFFYIAWKFILHPSEIPSYLSNITFVLFVFLSYSFAIKCRNRDFVTCFSSKFE